MPCGLANKFWSKLKHAWPVHGQKHVSRPHRADLGQGVLQLPHGVHHQGQTFWRPQAVSCLQIAHIFMDLWAVKIMWELTKGQKVRNLPILAFLTFRLKAIFVRAARKKLHVPSLNHCGSAIPFFILKCYKTKWFSFLCSFFSYKDHCPNSKGSHFMNVQSDVRDLLRRTVKPSLRPGHKPGWGNKRLRREAKGCKRLWL